MKKAIPSRYWISTFRHAYTLSRIDILPLLTKIQRDNLYIIRGTRDTFLCDELAVTIAKEHGFNIIEVDAGHNWNENIAEVAERILQ